MFVSWLVHRNTLHFIFWPDLLDQTCLWETPEIPSEHDHDLCKGKADSAPQPGRLCSSPSPSAWLKGTYRTTLNRKWAWRHLSHFMVRRKVFSFSLNYQLHMVVKGLYWIENVSFYFSFMKFVSLNHESVLNSVKCLFCKIQIAWFFSFLLTEIYCKRGLSFFILSILSYTAHH